MSQNNNLHEGAGENDALKPKENFERRPHPGCVYFIRADDAIKIGFASNFKARLGSLQTGQEKPLEVLAVISAADIGELEMHQRFAHLRLRGEWFRADKDLLQFIEYAKAKFGEAAPYQKAAKRSAAPRPPALADQLHALHAKHRGNVPIASRINNIIRQVGNLEKIKDPQHRAALAALMKRQADELQKLLIAA